MSEEGISMTPPLTPPPWGQEDDSLLMDSDSLDYLDFFTTDTEPAPPSSHRGGVGGAEKSFRVALFSCQGSPCWGQELSPGSYLASGSLISLLHHGNPSPAATLPPPTTVFHLPPCTPDNIHFHLQHYFLAIRQSISELERGAQSSFSLTQGHPHVTHTTHFARIREDVATFFTHLAGHTHSLKGGGETGFLRQVAECVMATLRYLGPLQDLPRHVTAAASPQGNKCPSAAYHLFHLHLDVRWWSLALLHSLHPLPGPLPFLTLVQEPSLPQGGAGAEAGEEDSFRQCSSMVTWDLLHLLALPVAKLSVSEVEESVRWPCGCCVELAVSLLHLMDHRASHHNTQSFWEEVRNRLLVLLKLYSDSSPLPASSTSPQLSSPSSCLTPGPSSTLAIRCPSDVLRSGHITHVWWFFYNLARLYIYDHTGNIRTVKSEVKGEPKLLRTLIRLTVGDPKVNTSDNKLSEAQLRSALRCCVLLCEVWGPGGISWEWVGPLWEHFSRRFNDSFMLPGATMEAHTTASRTVGGWVEEVQRLGRGLDVGGPHRTSWQLFLTLLGGAVKGGGGVGAGSGWRQVRGRVYSRFHGRLMGELSATGLHHTASLFLTLATVVDPVDVMNKLCELLMLVPGRGVGGRARVVWRSFLAGALVLAGAGADLAHLATKFTSLVATVATHYTAARDAPTRREFGQLMVVYGEGVQEVFEESQDLSLSQHTLLCGNVATVLPQSGISEVKAILGMLHAALAKVLTLTTPPHSLYGGSVQDVVGVVWAEFGPFLRSHALTLTPPRALGEVAASLTLCLTRLPPPASSGCQSPPPPRDAAQSLVTHFLVSEAINTTCSLHYGSWLLDQIDPGALPWPALEGQLVSSWLCALVTLGPQDEVQEMAIRLTALPGVASVLPKPAPSSSYALAKSLIKGVADKFSHIQNFSERMSYRERAVGYFCGVERAGAGLLKKVPLPAHLPRALDIMADIFLYAHQLIYAKSNPKCPLPGLMSGVFLAAPVYCTDKPLPQPLTSALSPAIPKVVRGLGSLVLVRDAYLQRCVRDLFTHYLPRYTAIAATLTPAVSATHHTTTPAHPILVCLEEREGVEGGVVEELRTVYLEVVRDAFLAKKTISNTHLQTALIIVNEGVERGWQGWVEECCRVLLLPLLEVLLTLEEHTTKRCTTHLLKQLLCRAKQSASPPRETLVGTVRQLVVRHLSWSSGQVFRVLRVTGVMYRALLLDALPHITRAVTATEEKRGTGLDNTLRRMHSSGTSSAVQAAR